MPDVRSVVRIGAIGSIDDGKSTLIGRLLLDTRSVFDDQLASAERTSQQRGDEYFDLSLLTDGLRAEREQGITIDVAYRHFRTSRRTFLLADCPGHEQYTRNMVTGCSTADVALLVVDVRRGMTEQTRRHATIASLLLVRRLIVCVNKMDLVAFERTAFERLRAAFARYAARLSITEVHFVPISALHGDNVTTRSSRMPWYEGPSLLFTLDNLHVASDRNLIDLRFPVQLVLRPRSAKTPDYRAYAGRVYGGVLRPGDRVLVLPQDRQCEIASVELGGLRIPEAFPPMSVSVRLTCSIDIGRGDVLARPLNRPHVGTELEAMVCVVAESILGSGATLTIFLGARQTRAVVDDVRYRLNVTTLRREPTRQLTLNEIGRVRLRTFHPLVFDEYRRSKELGCFVLVDEHDGRTVAGGMIIAPA